MSRTFNGSTQYLSRSSSPVTVLPLTMAGWMNAAAIGSIGTAFCLSSTAQASANSWRISISGSGGFVVTETAVNSAVSAITSSTVSAGTWNHICGIFATSTSRSIFMNGANKTTNTAWRTTTNIDGTFLGTSFTDAGNAIVNPFNGSLANFGLWNVALTDGEVAELATGLPCSAVRPDALVGWWRLLQNDGDVDWWKQNNLTATASPTFSQHPPVIRYPNTIRVISSATAAPPAGGPPKNNALLLRGVG